VLGNTQHGACTVTLVERTSGFGTIGLLSRWTAANNNARLHQRIEAQSRPVRTLTLDNGTGLHSYKQVEAVVSTRCYVATSHHSWERGSNENVTGLLPQYPPKRTSREQLTQRDCQRIADKLDRRPRKRLAFRTPEEVYDA
jgi:IS30 family transposase